MVMSFLAVGSFVPAKGSFFLAEGSFIPAEGPFFWLKALPSKPLEDSLRKPI